MIYRLSVIPVKIPKTFSQKSEKILKFIGNHKDHKHTNYSLETTDINITLPHFKIYY